MADEAAYLLSSIGGDLKHRACQVVPETMTGKEETFPMEVRFIWNSAGSAWARYAQTRCSLTISNFTDAPGAFARSLLGFPSMVVIYWQQNRG